MSNHRQRLKEIEVSLTPREVLFLWMRKVLPGTFEDAVFHFQPVWPRAAVANSIAGIVKKSLEGQPETLVEQAIHQARREADWLYMIVVDANTYVQEEFLQRTREKLFLLCYLQTTLHCRQLSTVPEEPIRSVTLEFVESILLLEGSVLRTSTEHFAGQPILFSDSATRLKKQLDMVDEVLEIFNSIAGRACFRPLNKKEISDRLVPEVEQQVERWSIVARGAMLGTLGDWSEFKANSDRFIASYSS
jgi:hypothetical protein